MISIFIFTVLIVSVVARKNYGKMAFFNQGIFLLAAFAQFILSLIIFGCRIVKKSEDRVKIKQFTIGISIVVSAIILLTFIVVTS